MQRLPRAGDGYDDGGDGFFIVKRGGVGARVGYGVDGHGVGWVGVLGFPDCGEGWAWIGLVVGGDVVGCEEGGEGREEDELGC